MAAQQKIDYNLLLIAGLIVGGYFVGKSILEKLGLKESAEDAATKAKLKNQETKLNIWGGVTSLQKAAGTRKAIQVLTKAGAEFYAKQINKAFGIVNDDEQAIYGVFRQLRFKSQVASVVTAFFNLYKRDLLTTLKSKLSESELAEIINIIETKPLGITNR
jgi:L-fucose mutarotase/ribose pyranase (RbsD/FucU family)